MTAALVGSIFILLGECLVSALLIYLFFRVGWFIPTQGTSTSDYTTPIKKAIPLALGLASLLAKLIGLGLDRWDEVSFYGNSSTRYVYFGLIGSHSTDIKGVDRSYSSVCSSASDVATCQFGAFGAGLVFALALTALLGGLFCVVNSISFFFRPNWMQTRIFLVWRVSAVTWVITLAAANTWGGVAHLCLASGGGRSGVSWSYNAFNAAFFIDWFLYVFNFFAVKNTPTGHVPLGVPAEALAASEARVRVLEQELAERDAQSRQSVMLHPSIAVPVAVPVTAVPVTAVPAWPLSSPSAPPPPRAFSDIQAEQQPAFYSSYQPPRSSYKNDAL